MLTTEHNISTTLLLRLENQSAIFHNESSLSPRSIYDLETLLGGQCNKRCLQQVPPLDLAVENLFSHLPQRWYRKERKVLDIAKLARADPHNASTPSVQSCMGKVEFHPQRALAPLNCPRQKARETQQQQQQQQQTS